MKGLCTLEGQACIVYDVYKIIGKVERVNTGSFTKLKLEPGGVS